MRDPKFGYHWLWMLPLAMFADALGKIIDTVARYRHRRRIRQMLRRHPDIARLGQLAGIGHGNGRSKS